MNKYVFRNRYTLLATCIVTFILVVVIEGIVMNRESRVYTFENPYFDLNLNDIEAFENRILASSRFGVIIYILLRILFIFSDEIVS